MYEPGATIAPTAFRPSHVQWIAPAGCRRPVQAVLTTAPPAPTTWSVVVAGRVSRNVAVAVLASGSRSCG